MVKKLLIGAAAGAGAMYFLDPNKGPERRRQALRLWSENKDDVLETATKAGGTAAKLTSTIADTASQVGGGSGGHGKDPNSATGGVRQHVVNG